jgi:hypothetical protein
LSKEEFMIYVADSSSSMDMHINLSSSLDWSQPINRTEESLELKWDDDDDDKNKSDDDQSQRPLEMKVNPSSQVEQSNDGRCLYNS